MSPPTQGGSALTLSPSSSSSAHPLAVLTHTVLTSPLSTRLLDQTNTSLIQRIHQTSSRHRAIRRLDSVRSELATSLEGGSPSSSTASELSSFAERYASGLAEFESAWDQAASNSSSSAGSRDDIWTKLPSFASKVVAGGMRTLLSDPLKTGRHLASLGAEVLVKAPSLGGRKEAELVLELMSSVLGSGGVLRLVEGYAIGVVEELVRDEGGPRRQDATSTADPARQRELESSFVAMMGLVNELGLDVAADEADSLDGGIAARGSPFAFNKSLELVLLEALASPDVAAADIGQQTLHRAPKSSARHGPTPSMGRAGSDEGTATSTGWGATFSSMLFSPPSTPGPSTDFPWAKRGGWVPAGAGADSVGDTSTQRRSMDTRSISGPSPILKSPLGRMFRSPSLSSFGGSSSVAESSTTRPFTSLAGSVLRLLSRPSASASATSSSIPSKTPLLQAVAISLLRTRFPFDTHPKSHRRVLLLLVIRFYSFHLLRRVLTGSAAVPPLPLPSRGVDMTSVQGSPAQMEFAGAGASKGRGPLLVDVWKGDKGEAKLDKLHLRVHLALVEAAGFGGAGGGGTSSAKLGASFVEEVEEELARAAKRVLEAFGAGIALEPSTAGLQEPHTTPPENAMGGIEIETLRALELSLEEVLSLLRVARPLVTFSNSLGSFGQSPGGLAGFRRGTDFKNAERLKATGPGRWGSSSATDLVLAEEDFDATQSGITRLAAPTSSSSVILFASPSHAQGAVTISFTIPEAEKTPHVAFMSSSPSMRRGLGSYGATLRVGKVGTRRGSTASIHSPTMSPALDTGGADYFGLELVLEEPSDEGDISRTEKEVIFRALIHLIRDGHLTTVPPERSPPDLVALLTRAATTAEDAFNFATALSYRQALEGLTQVVKKHPHLSHLNFTRLLAPLVTAAVAAETKKAAQQDLVQTRLLEVDQKESALLLAARRAVSALHDLRTRAHFALEVLPSERVADLRAALAEIKSGELDLDEDGVVSSWLSETNLAVDFTIGDSALHASCYIVDQVLRRIADAQVLFRSPLWAREAAVTEPFLQSNPVHLNPTFEPPSPGGISCLSFGVVSSSLLRPGEPTSPQLSYITTFILRLRTRFTGFLLAELESQGDLVFPEDDWFERESHRLPTPIDGPSHNLPTEWTSPLLQTFLLHPSPHAKLQALFSLELLCVAKKSGPFTTGESDSTNPSLPVSTSLSSIRSTPPRHTVCSPSVSASPTLHRISKAIDSHPHSAAPDPASPSSAVIPDAIWSLGASLSSLVFGGPVQAASVVGGGAGGGKLDQVREASTIEPPNTDELVAELSSMIVRHPPKNLPASLVKIAFFVPGEILDFKPDGKAFLDFGLAVITLRADLLDILQSEAKEIVRKGGYATKEERARALELLDLCAKEGSDEARRAVKALMTPWAGGQ